MFKPYRRSYHLKTINNFDCLRNFGLPFLLFQLFFLSGLPLVAQEESFLDELHETILKVPDFDKVKILRIDSLRYQLHQIRDQDLRKLYDLNQQLLNEYRIFKQDSAFSYGLRTRELAQRLQDGELEAAAVINLADISVSAGMYKEAQELLDSIDPEGIPPNIRSLYYGLLGRCYSEMAEYSNLSYFSTRYNSLAEQYRRMALELTEENTFFNSFLKAFIQYKNGERRNALKEFRELLKENSNIREKALLHYSMGDIYTSLGNSDSAIAHFAQASIADIKSSTKENLALVRLAELLYLEEDYKNASVIIKKANKDASFYGAQQRKIRVGAVLPLIEGEIVEKIEEQRQNLLKLTVSVSVLLIFVLALAGIIYFQVRRLRKAKKAIGEVNARLQETNFQIKAVNEEIREKNQELSRVNDQLVEANLIKEEYIGFFFSQDADIFEKFRDFKFKVEQYLDKDEVAKAKFLVSGLNLKREKGKLLQNFDEAFIKLFPNFIEEFNSLLKPEEQISLRSGQLLNKELRIFALIRLGITHNEIIAQILGYSVNSIYAYKTKIRNKSLDKKDFDQKLLEKTTIQI